MKYSKFFRKLTATREAAALAKGTFHELKADWSIFNEENECHNSRHAKAHSQTPRAPASSPPRAAQSALRVVRANALILFCEQMILNQIQCQDETNNTTDTAVHLLLFGHNAS